MKGIFFSRTFFALAAVFALAFPGFVPAQTSPPNPPAFAWNLLWTGSWEENRTLHNRMDIGIGLVRQGLLLRGQILDRRPLDFESGDTWADFSQRTAGGESLGLYHRSSGSRFLYGVIDESGLPVRIRSPWRLSPPYAQNRRQVSADLRTTSSATRLPEAYLYLATPRTEIFGSGFPAIKLPAMMLRGFASAQINSQGTAWPAFSGGLEVLSGANTVRLETFFTGTRLPEREGSAWFNDPPGLPQRDFHLGAAALTVGTPYVLFASDFAWSSTFAFGSDFYSNAAVRISPPLSHGARPGPWSFSFSLEGMGERYVGRDGLSPGGGMRIAGRVERRGRRSGLFRADTNLRSSGLNEPFNRSSSNISYRFPNPAANAAMGFPLRVSRLALGSGRNASDAARIQDSVDGSIGLSLALPPMLLPQAFLPQTAAGANSVARVYPLGINFFTTVRWNGAGGQTPSAFPLSNPEADFASARTGSELLWSPGIFQFRTRWHYTAYPQDDGDFGGSFSAAVRFRKGRLSLRMAWPVFPADTEYTLSWRMEL